MSTIPKELREAIEDRIKRWAGASKDYNDWLKHLAPKHRFGTNQTQCLSQ